MGSKTKLKRHIAWIHEDAENVGKESKKEDSSHKASNCCQQEVGNINQVSCGSARARTRWNFWVVFCRHTTVTEFDDLKEEDGEW